MIFDHANRYSSQWEAVCSIAAKIGCSGETLRKWVRQAERDRGQRPRPTSQEGERIKELERENRELRQANEILRKASAPGDKSDAFIQGFQLSVRHTGVCGYVRWRGRL
jgi:transposase-like protein